MGVGPRALRVAAAAVLVVGFGVRSGSAGDCVGVIARGGDKLTSRIVPGDADAYAVELGERSVLTVQAATVKKSGSLLPTLQLFAPDGTRTDVGALVKGAGRPKITLSKFIAPVGGTGTWRVVVGGRDSTSGNCLATFTVKHAPPAGAKKLAVAAGTATSIRFTGAAGALVTAAVKVSRGALASARIVAPDGSDVAALVPVGSTWKLAKAPLGARFGTHELVITTGAEDAQVDASVKVKFARPAKRVATLPDEATFAAWDLGVVRQGGSITGSISASHLIVGSSARLVGDGVAVDGVEVSSADAASVTVSAADDAAYGARDLDWCPPPLDGEPARLPAAVVVRAPVPTIAVAPATVVVQGESSLVRVAGTGFRAAGTLAAAGTGLVVGATTVTSAAEASVTVTAAPDAPAGPSAIIYTQPAAGGGDTAALASAVTVHYPSPSVSLVSPAVLRQGDTGVVATVTGADFRADGTVSVSGTGVTVRSVTLDSASSLTAVLDVASDAAFGARSVTFTHAAIGGGATATRSSALTVHAPDPAVASVSPGVVRQGEPSVTMTVHGSGFRSGGTVGVSGTLVTFGVTSFVSETQVTVPVAADTAAAVGARNVTYSQPATGGGAASTLVSAFTVHHPNPTITTVFPTSVRQGATVTFTVNGTGFRTGGTVSVSGTGLTLGTTTFASETQMTVAITADATAAVGARDLTYRQPTAGGAATAVFASAFTVFHPDPTVTAASPSSIRQGESGVSVTLTGTNFRDGASVAFSGAGLTVTSPTRLSDTQFRVTVACAADAVFGARNVTCTQPSAGGGAAGALVSAFTVRAPDPTITSVSPGTAKQGVSAISGGPQVTTLTVTGSGFRTGCSVASSPADLSFGTPTVLSDTQITVAVSVDAGDPFGARSIVYTQPAAGGGASFALVSSLTVVAPDPSIFSVSPTTLTQGATVTLIVSGQGLRSGGAISISGTGLTVGSTSFVDEVAGIVRMSASVSASSAATVGARDVAFMQPASGGGATATRVAVLAILHPDPTVAAVSPATIRQGEANVTVTLTGTNFRDGASVAFSGSGLTVTDPMRLSDTQFQVTVACAADAAFGARNVTCTQPSAGGGAAGALVSAFTVRAPDPTITSVSPAIVQQGQTSITVTVNGAGLRSGGTVSISGTLLTVGSTTFVSETQVTVPVAVDVGAAVGTRNVTYTQPSGGGGASVVASGAFTVNHPDPTLTTVSPLFVEQGTSGTLTLTGLSFRSGGTVGVSGTGVTLSNPAFVSTTQFTASYSVSGSAATGLRDVSYAQPSAGGGASATRAGAVQVKPPRPTLTSLTPSAWPAGSALFRVTALGTGFDNGTTSSVSGSGVTVHSTAFVSATELSLLISVTNDAAVGPRDVTVTPSASGGPAATFSAAVTLLPPDPQVVRFSHAVLALGATNVAVTIEGHEFRSADHASVSGSGVSLSSVVVAGPSSITALATVSAGAATGPRSITVTRASSEGGRSGTLPAATRIASASPTVSSIVPSTIGVTASGGPTRDIPVTVTGTGFMTGATLGVSASGGSGLSVKAGSVVVVSDTTLTALVTVTPSASQMAWDLLVVNPGGLGNSGTTGNARLTIVSSTTLCVNAVVPSSGSAYGGERVVVWGSGLGQGYYARFGSVDGRAAQVIDANTMLVTVPKPASSSVSAATVVSVTVDTGTGNAASLANGYSYARDAALFFEVKTFPAHQATGVPVNLKRTAVLLRAPCDTTSGVHGGSVTANSIWFEQPSPPAAVAASNARGFGPQERWLVLQRPSGAGNLASNAKDTVNVPTALKSLAGVPLTPVTLSSNSAADQTTFTTASGTTDTTAPTVVTAAPAANASAVDPSTKIVFGFSEEIDPLTVLTASFALTDTTGGGSVGVFASIELASDARTVTLTPRTMLGFGRTYRTSIGAGVTDLCGNALTATQFNFTTATSDGAAPAFDRAIVERLPADLDGSGTYVAANGSGGNAFDVLVPRSGFLLETVFSDAGGSGIDVTTFSARCSVAVGGNAANAELASNFVVTPAGASWRVPAGTDVTAGEDVTFTFQVSDLAGNPATQSSVTVDVVDANTTAVGASGSLGGDHDPFDSRRTVVLRADLDAYTVSFTSRSSPTIDQGCTTTVAANGVLDIDESLRFTGLGTANMTGAAAATVNGVSRGTNEIVRRLFVERTRRFVRRRFGIEEDGTRGADSVNVEFLLPGEQGSLSSAPSLSSSTASVSSRPFTEISLGGTLGADSNAFNTSTTGRAWIGFFDPRNLNEHAILNTGTSGQSGGALLLGALKLLVNKNTFFKARVSDKLIAVHGGTPAGEGADDDDVLSGSFDRTSASNTAAQNARYDAILDAIDLVALFCSSPVAATTAAAAGLVPDGAPKTGLFGGAHFSNTFTEATSTSPNVANHLNSLGNDLMADPLDGIGTMSTGTDFQRFSPLDIAYLLNRLFYDEGR